MPIESATNRSSYQNDLSELQAEFDRKKKKLSNQQQEELDELKKNYQSQKHQAVEESQATVNHIKEKQNEEIAKAAEARTKLLKSTQTQLSEIEQKNQNRVEVVRDRANQEYENLQARHKAKKTSLEKQNQMHLANLKSENEHQIKSEVHRGRETYQKVREISTKDLQKAHESTQTALVDERQSQESKLRQLDLEAKKRFEHRQKSWNERETQLNEVYSSRIISQKESYQDQLKELNKRFESAYQKNNGDHKTALQIQSQNFAKELAEQRMQFLRETDKYTGKAADPFYKVQDRGSQINEHPNYYVLEAYVPEHEKDSVKVIIEKDKAVIAGQRAFKEKFADEKKSLSSNSYQTFREEFGFDKPVIMEGVARERSGDYVIFTIPKLNSFADRKINRKA